MIDDDKPVGSVLEPLRIPQGTSPAFSIVDPAGTWAWRSGPVDAAAVRQCAVLALLPVEAAVQPPVEAAVQLRAEAAVVELPRRAEAAVQRRAVLALLPVEAAVQLRAEAAVQRRAEAALLPAEAAVQLRAEAAVAELPRRAEAANAPRWLEACLQEALKRCRTADCRRRYPWRYRCRWLFHHAVAHREAHDCPAESQCCRCRFSYQRRRYPRCPVTARQEACDYREASRRWLRGRLLRPWCLVTARQEACDCRKASRRWLRGRLLRP